MRTADFRDRFFPLPKTVCPNDQPQWDDGMFKGLENAQDMVEAKIAEEFVSRHLPTSSLTADHSFFRSRFSSP